MKLFRREKEKSTPDKDIIRKRVKNGNKIIYEFYQGDDMKILEFSIGSQQLQNRYRTPNIMAVVELVSCNLNPGNYAGHFRAILREFDYEKYSVLIDVNNLNHLTNGGELISDFIAAGMQKKGAPGAVLLVYHIPL